MDVEKPRNKSHDFLIGLPYILSSHKLIFCTRFLKYYRYMASGASMTSMSYQYLVGVTTVSNIIQETCAVIWDSFYPLVLPGLEEKDWINIANGFEKWNFSHCIGAIDGKHVVIQVCILITSTKCTYSALFSTK